MVRQWLIALGLASSMLVGCTPTTTPNAVETPPDSSAIADEAASSAQTEPSPTPTAAVEPTEPVTADHAPDRSGTFVSAEHPTQGTARLVSTPSGTVLEFEEDFQTDNGPDLVVVLHTAVDVIGSTTPPAYPLQESDYITIAPLQSVQGMQQYAIPDTIELSAYQSVAIWCQQFNATFGAASLN
ncbi:MAG: DM13 domain-containing protein [Cyanobacteria bacterium J06659_2]